MKYKKDPKSAALEKAADKLLKAYEIVDKYKTSFDSKKPKINVTKPQKTKFDKDKDN